MRRYMGFGSGSTAPADAGDVVGTTQGTTGDAKSERGEAEPNVDSYMSYFPSLGSVGGWLWRGESSAGPPRDEDGLGEGQRGGDGLASGAGSHGLGVRGLLRRVKSGDDDGGVEGALEDGSPHHHHHHHHLHLSHHHPHLHVRGLLRRALSGEEGNEEAAMAMMKESIAEMVGGVRGGKDGAVVKVIPGKRRDRLIEQLCMSEAERERICRQFLRARHGDPRAAINMLRQTLKWRQSVDIDSYLVNKRDHLRGSESFMPIFILSNNIDCKQPIVYALPRMYDKKKVEKTALRNAVLAFFEALYYEHVYASDQIVAIMDFRGWSIRRHAPYRAVKDGISLLQEHYPDRLGKIFLVNYPTTLRAAYTVISPIIDGVAKEKIVWLAEDIEETLAKHLSPKSIPTWLGGELQASIPGVDMEQEWRNGVPTPCSKQ